MMFYQPIPTLFSLAFFLSTICKAQNNYCIPTSSCANVSYITNVTFSTINNSTGSYCSANGYTYYTSSVKTPILLAGTQTTIGVSYNASFPYSNNIAVWIDYNQNGSFEPSEFTLISSAAYGPVAANITIPVTASGGTTRMRVRRRVDGLLTAADACLSYASGETEDYNLYIQKITISHQVFTDTLYNRVITLSASITQTDFGIDNSDSLRPRLWLRKYGTTKWVAVKGTLRSGTLTNGQWDFAFLADSLQLRKNGCDSVQYYFVAQDIDTPSFIGYLPLGAKHTNVQIQINPPLSLFGFRTKPVLKDTIYIGSTLVPNCQCSSLTNEGGLFQEINTKSLQGAMVVIVEGDLQESGKYSLDGPKTAGYVLSIRPDAPTVHTIYASGYNVGTLKLDSVQHFTLDGSHNGTGRYLRFSNKTVINNYDTICNVKLYRGCEDITIRNIVFEHLSYNQYNNSASVYLAGSKNRQISITDNLFQENTGSTSWPSQHILSVGDSNTALVKRNEFSNFLQAGVAVESGHNWIIDSNHFYRTANPVGLSGAFNAIKVSGGGHEITNNYIGGKGPYASNGFFPLLNNGPALLTGILVTAPRGAAPVLVENNRINNISASVTYSAIASLFAGIVSNSNPTIIRQNIIGSMDTSVYTLQVFANSVNGICVQGNCASNVSGNSINGLLQPDWSGANYMAGIYTVLADTVNNNVTGNTVFHLRNNANITSPNPVEIGGTIGIQAKGGLKNTIERNLIYDLSVTQGAVSGIAFYRTINAQPSFIQRNRIFDLVNTNTSPCAYCGDGDDYGKSAINGIVVRELSNDLSVMNNQLSIDNRRLVNPITVRGIFSAGYMAATSKHDIVYNSIHVAGNASGNNGSAAFASYTLPTTRLYNNLFINQRKGGSLSHFIYRIQSSPPNSVVAAVKANDNFYVSTDTGRFAQWGNTPFIGWNDWKTYTAFDDTSTVKPLAEIPVSQLFVNKNQGNLSINTNDVTSWEVADKGLPFSNYKDDYDSVNVRADTLPFHTDVGSDEFTPAVNSPGLLCGCTCRMFTAEVSSATYQWQVDNGAGFQNISDDAVYSGTQTGGLQLNNAPTAWYGKNYRAVVSSGTSIGYGKIYTLRFLKRWTGAVSTSWSNPANWECGVLPDNNTDVYVNAGLQNFPVVDINGICRTIAIEDGASITIGAGFMLTITH